MRHTDSKRLLKHTELASLPDVVYVCKEVVGRPFIRFNSRDSEVPLLSISPSTVADNYARIDRADPIGFLIAIMNGQPILSLDTDGKPLDRIVPTLEERAAVAAFFAEKMTPRKWQREDKKDDDYATLIKKHSGASG